MADTQDELTAKSENATKPLPDVEYLKAWVTRTKSDAVVVKQVPTLIDDVLNNLDELEKYLEGLE